MLELTREPDGLLGPPPLGGLGACPQNILNFMGALRWFLVHSGGELPELEHLQARSI